MSPAALDPFPSTNDLNKTKNAPYVEFVSHTANSVTLRFVNPKAQTVWFEVKKDNQSPGTNKWGPCRIGIESLDGACNGKRYLAEDDYSYPSQSVAGSSTKEYTVTGLSEKVSVRSTFGPERNWDFDWVPFNVYNPDPEGKHQMSISGSVYRDHKLNDCFGLTSCNDKAENLGQGWEINLYKENSSGGWDFVKSTQTNSEGNFSFSAVKDAGTYYVCEVVRTGWAQQTQNWSGTPYHINTNNLSGNSSEGPYCRTINYADTGDYSNKFYFGNVDTKKPITEVVSPLSGNSYKTDNLPTVNASSSDNESGLVQLTMNLYGSSGLIKSCVNKPLLPAIASETFSCDLSTLASYLGDEGQYYLRVNSRDAGNNTSNTVTWNFAIDNTVPAVPASLSWKTFTNKVIPNGGATKEVSGTASWDASASSDVDHYIYKYWNAIDGNQYKVGSEYTTTVNTTSLAGVFNQGEGTHYYCVVAVDAAGNESNCSNPFEITYTIDRTAPAAPIILAPTARQWLKSSPILNAWSEVTKDINGDDEEIDHYQIAYNYDDGHTFGGGNTCPGLVMVGVDGFIGCRDVNGTSRSHQPADSEQGGVTIWVRAIDVDGNAGAWSKSVHYYFDKTSPATDINVSSVVDGKFTVSGTATDNLALNRVYVQLVSRVTNDRCGGTTINLITSPFSTSSPWAVDYNISTLKVTGTSTACVDGDFAAHVSVTDMTGNSGTAGWTSNFTVITPENGGDNGGDNGGEGDDNSSTTPETTPASTSGGGGLIVFTPATFSTAVTTPSTEGRVLGATAYQFTQNLKLGSVHDEVKALQKFLNLKGFIVATSGAGSLGNETRVFGPKTKAALIKYQEANPTILTNVEITNGKGTGNFFWSTRGFVNEILLEDFETSALLSD